MGLLLIALLWGFWLRLLASNRRRDEYARWSSPVGVVPPRARWAFIGITGLVLIGATYSALT